MWAVVVLAAISALPSSQCTCAECRRGQPTSVSTAPDATKGDPRFAESPNFQIHSHPGCCDARQIAPVCEVWRDHLRRKWLSTSDEQSWTPRCVVVVHARRESYLAAVGRGGERSFGSSWIDTSGGGVSGRRVDLLVNERGQITALGHELTHVVIADAFGGKQPPPWANEGVALLADSPDKQARHEQDAARAIRSQTAFRCLELMTIDQYPSPDRIPAFYGQSASLVKVLCQRGEPRQLVTFLKQAEEVGYERALAQTYAIAGGAELQRLWDESLAAKPDDSQVAVRVSSRRQE